MGYELRIGLLHVILLAFYLFILILIRRSISGPGKTFVASWAFFFRIVSTFSIMKTLTFLVHAEVFYCFYSPSYSDMDNMIFNTEYVRM